MASVYKNLRYCEIYHDSEYYDVMIAVDDLDEVNNILQEWAIEEIGEALDLPEDLVQNYDAKEINIKTKNIDSFVYLLSGSGSYANFSRYAGMSGTLPTFPTALADSAYVMPAGTAYLYSQPNFEGSFGEYTLTSKSFTLASGVNFIGARYNSGSPEYALYTDDTSFDYSSIIPVVGVLYYSSTIYNVPYGQMGDGLPEKLIEIQKNRNEFKITSNFTLDDSTLYVELGELTVQRGSASISCTAVDSEEANNDMVLNYKDSSSVWQTSAVTQINNTQYQSTSSGLQSLAGGEFVINYIYRVANADKKIVFTVLSNKFASLAAAKESDMITDLPDIIKESAVLVGRMIIEQGSSSPTVQKVQTVSFGTVA